MSKLGSKITTICSWLIFVGVWMTLLGQLLFHWKQMNVDLHLDLIGYLLFGVIIWSRLAREKDNETELFSLSMTFLFILGIVHRLL
jgi:hypothetical protein